MVAEEGETKIPVRITQQNETPVAELRQTEPTDQQEHQLSEESGAVERPEAQTVEPKPAETPLQPQKRDPRSVTHTTEEKRVEAPRTDEGQSGRARAFLGTSPGTYGNPREVWSDSTYSENPLPNPHVSITGETGSGKTQATKSIIKELGQYEIPALILDFKDDYAEPVYAETEALQVYDASYESLPFNPLAPPIDLRTGQVNPTSHIYRLGEIVKRIYRLGDQQTHRLREAFKLAYEGSSIQTRAFEPSPEQTYPPFEEVRVQLEAVRGNEALLGRLSPIFDLGLFSSEGRTEFGGVVTSSTVVRLGQHPGGEIKNSVAEFFLMALYNHLIRQRQTHSLGRLLVLDEAWRLVESPFLEPLMREGRAFGLGVLIATQFPGDLPGVISGSTATKLFFSQTQIDQIREIQRTVVGKTSGPDADHLAGVLKGLAPLTCVLHSKQHLPFVRVNVKPYFERRNDQIGYQPISR